jgi:hypothetical protein
MRRALATIVFVALGALPLAGSTERLRPGATVTLSPQAQYAVFLKARNEALGAWLPSGEDLFEPWRLHLAATSALGWDEMFTVPRGATYFWYGPAGPPKVHLVYDPVHHVALYRQGCCAWEESVLTTASTPPPRTVKAANLSGVRSKRGIALGASPDAVRRAYGPARLHGSTKKPALRVLSYYRNQHVKYSGCGWFENFVFRANRLIEIQAGHGC